MRDYLDDKTEMYQAEVCLNKTKKLNQFAIWQICKFKPNSDIFLKSKIKKKKKKHPNPGTPE